MENAFFCVSSKEYKVVWNIKWSGNVSERTQCENLQSLWHTHETQGPSTSIARSHMPQLFTVFPSRLSTAGGQKCDFCKSHSRGEDKVVHSFWVVKVWQSGVRYRHWPVFSFFFSKNWLRPIDGENFLDYFFSSYDIYWRWKRYSTSQFLRLVIFSIYSSSISINCHTFTFQKEWTTLSSPQECDLRKSHFWPPALDSLDGKVVKSCGMWEHWIFRTTSCSLLGILKLTFRFLLISFFKCWFFSSCPFGWSVISLLFQFHFLFNWKWVKEILQGACGKNWRLGGAVQEGRPVVSGSRFPTVRHRIRGGVARSHDPGIHPQLGIPVFALP